MIPAATLRPSMLHLEPGTSNLELGTQNPEHHAVVVQHLYVSPGHNFRGHHGRPPGTHAITEVAALQCVAGRGLVGDRYFDYRPDYKGQITFLDAAVYRAVCGAFGRAVPPSALRRNVVLDGADLDRLIGQRFSLQGIWFYGVEECRPCYWMDHAIAPGAEDFLQGRGGLRARILTDGCLHAGPSLLEVA